MPPMVAHRLVVFGPQHLLVLGIFATGCILVFVLGDRLRTRPGTRRW
ncbi:hypothetical protein [Leekyejoonella antrihumi]|nr:hypothetical protein [Leekyejoonella antrihumi]